MGDTARQLTFARADMAAEIFGVAALFWILIPVGLAGGWLVLKLQGNNLPD